MKKCLLLLFFAAPVLAGGPQISCDEPRYDMGLLVQGDSARHSFLIRNTGGSPLEVQAVNTSCGCTAALPADKVIPPGGRSRIDVTYDTRGKLGDVDKQIRVWTDDPGRPLLVLTILGKVVPSEHPDMTGTKNLFEGSCAACHAAPAAGKKGEALFNAACAMCHRPLGSDGKRVGPAPEGMSALPAKALGDAIAHGKDGASMPAFGPNAGGPLDRAQIKSLVVFIRSVKKK